MESFGRYFSFCPRLIWQNHSYLISSHLFDGIWCKLKDGLFLDPLTQPILAELGIMKIAMSEVIK